MELVHRPATELAALIASGELSAASVVEAFVSAAVTHAHALNAFVTMALLTAGDAAASPRPGPLSGLPFTVKDNIAVSGAPFVIGVPEREGSRADADAVAVARLREAGAIFFGKTNLPPWGGGIETDNEVFGRTNNPYSLSHSVGGSSGGEAAAVASGCSAFGLGTDSGASVRLPAHFCGLAALKPTAGRVPITGVFDDVGPVGPLRDPRTQIGILARSVADVALVLSVIEDRPGARPIPAAWPPTASALHGLRVSLLADDGISPPDADTARVVAAAARALSDAGACVDDVAPPGGGHALTEEVWASYGADAISYDLLGRWDAYRAELAAFPYDLILSPVYPSAAPRHGEVANHTSYTTPQNMSGWAAATVRCGTSADGLPIGVQLAAPPWRDEVALAAALALERALGGYSPPPASALTAPPPSQARSLR